MSDGSDVLTFRDPKTFETIGRVRVRSGSGPVDELNELECVDDVVYANRSMLCLHTATGGRKKIRLPEPAWITDLWTGQRSARPVREISAQLPHFRTKAWRTEYV